MKNATRRVSKKRRTPRTPRSVRRLRRSGFTTPPARGFLSRLASGLGGKQMMSSALRTLLNRPDSWTMTGSKRKRTDVTLTSDVTGLVKKDLGIVYMKAKGSQKPIKTVGKYFYHDMSEYVVDGFQGQQITDFVECIFTRRQLIGPATNVINEREAYADDLFFMNPYSVKPTNPIYPNAQGTALSAQDKMLIKHVNSQISLLSMSKVPQEVYVYYMTPKFDTGINPIVAWGNIVTSKNEQQATQGPISDYTTNPTAGQASIADWGANPFHHKEFRNHWKCVKSSHVVLQAGEQVDLRCKFVYDKVFTRQCLENVRNQEYLSGLTIFPIILGRAGLEGIRATDTTDALHVAYGGVKVGIIHNQHITLGALPATRFSSNRTYTGHVVNTALPQKIIDDDDQIVDGNDEL